MGSASSTCGSPRPRQRWRSSSLTKVGAANGLPLCEEREREGEAFGLVSLSQVCLLGSGFLSVQRDQGALCCVVWCCAVLCVPVFILGH